MVGYNMKKITFILAFAVVLATISTTATAAPEPTKILQSLEKFEEVPWLHFIIASIIGFLIGYFGMKLIIAFS